ncbi:MAG: hypothetical protein AMJ65_08515 [Phycisphaerae bacterium SG8_4]|nr:MAG: hypothetical protein AMJ65_08515 [Phycisphaerae bacterium SG8_4]
MKPTDNFEKLIRDLHVLDINTSPEMDQRILHETLKLQQELKQTKLAGTQPDIWRINMKSPIAKLAAAAMIAIFAALSMTFLERSTTSAYALDQTVEANHSVRYIHIKGFSPSHKEPKEYWVECDESGQLKNARWHMPEWDAPEDGAKVVVWKEDTIYLWFKGTAKKEGCLVTYREENGADWLYQYAQAYNPKLTVERLYEQQAQGKVKIEVDEPVDKAKPIVVTATYLSESSKSGRREVLLVDRDTKLITTVKRYRLKDGKYECRVIQEFHDYNQPIDPGVFDLDKEVPVDVKRIDRDLKRANLNKGISPDELAKYENMTPKEMTQVFFQACADEDWDELIKFMPDSEVSQKAKDYYGGLEIINIGEPFESETYHGLYVPYEIKLKSGRIKKWNLAVTNRNLVERYMFDGGF